MRSNLRLTLLSCFCLVSGGIFAQNQQQTQAAPTSHAFSVLQTVDYAAKHNVQVKNALIDIQVQQQTNRGITAMALPQVNGAVGATYYPYIPVQVFPNFIAQATYGVLAQEGVKDGNGNPIKAPSDYGYVSAAFGTKWNASAGITLQQILFDGQVFVGLQARRASIDYQSKMAEVTEENIRANIYKVYYQLVASKVQMEQIDANIERTQKLLYDITAMHKNGFAEKTDVDKTSVQLVNLQTEKLKAQTTIDNGYYGLKYLIGMPVTDTLILTDAITEDKIKSEALMDTAYQYKDRRDYQLLEQANLLNEYNIKRYKYAYLPTAALQSQLAKQAYRGQFDFFGKGDWYTTWYVGLNINIPIFDGFAKDANVQKAKLQAQQTANQLDYLKISIDNDVLEARNRYHTSILTLDAQQKNMTLAENVYNQTKKKYEGGLASTTDITNTQADLRVAQANYVSALYDAIIAKVDYIKAIGKL